jgi:hypothetical protein
MVYYTRLEKLAKDKHSSLLGPFVRYKENAVNIPPEAVFTIFFITYEWAQKARVVVPGKHFQFNVI